ncbi:hypothetical protein LCGC14_1201220 [marine sediment metagenome]|uniref:3'-5' exonuclease domain-containing protein n=1 Tax=marine sediment metagenome TaxID=412755 RepID=A0A0F9LL77_9ZZZZ
MTEGIAYTGPVTLTDETLPGVLARLNSDIGMVSCDTETISVKDKTCLGIGVALSEVEAIYFQVLPEMSPHIDVLQGVLCNEEVLKIMHNALFDLEVLSIVGFIWEWEPIDLVNIADTSSMARVQALPAGLHDLSLSLLDRYIMTYQELIYGDGDKKRHPLDIPWEEVANKCLQDCLATYSIYPKLW